MGERTERFGEFVGWHGSKSVDWVHPRGHGENGVDISFPEEHCSELTKHIIAVYNKMQWRSRKNLWRPGGGSRNGNTLPL